MKAKTKKALKVAGWAAFGLGAVAVAREAYLALGPWREARRKLYEAALARAVQLKLPLVVLGDPDSGVLHHLLGRDYQCGMICIDPMGCGGCESGVRAIADDPTNALSRMGTNSAVIFDAGLFAKAPDGAALATQMKRVAGANIFMFDVSPYTLTRLFEPKRRRTLKALPTETGKIEWTNRWLTPEPTGGKQGALALRGGGLLGYIPQPDMAYYGRLVSSPEPKVYFEI